VQTVAWKWLQALFSGSVAVASAVAAETSAVNFGHLSQTLDFLDIQDRLPFFDLITRALSIAGCSMETGVGSRVWVLSAAEPVSARGSGCERGTSVEGPMLALD